MESLVGAAQMSFELLTPWRRPDRTSWGATPEEDGMGLPGDEFVVDPTWGYTHAVTVDAPPAEVWRWIVQLGQGRGGFYSFELLENLVGCRVRNTDRLIDEFQTLEVGDAIRLHPAGPEFLVAIADAPSCLALVGRSAAPGEPPVSLWSFHALDDGAGATRLLERGSYRAGSGRLERATMGPAILEPVAFVMSRQMLRTIKRLAEQARPDRRRS